MIGPLEFVLASQMQMVGEMFEISVPGRLNERAQRHPAHLRVGDMVADDGVQVLSVLADVGNAIRYRAGHLMAPLAMPFAAGLVVDINGRVTRLLDVADPSEAAAWQTTTPLIASWIGEATVSTSTLPRGQNLQCESDGPNEWCPCWDWAPYRISNMEGVDRTLACRMCVLAAVRAGLPPHVVQYAVTRTPLIVGPGQAQRAGEFVPPPERSLGQLAAPPRCPTAIGPMPVWDPAADPRVRARHADEIGTHVDALAYEYEALKARERVEQIERLSAAYVKLQREDVEDLMATPFGHRRSSIAAQHEARATASRAWSAAVRAQLEERERARQLPCQSIADEDVDNWPDAPCPACRP